MTSMLIHYRKIIILYLIFGGIVFPANTKTQSSEVVDDQMIYVQTADELLTIDEYQETQDGKIYIQSADKIVEVDTIEDLEIKDPIDDMIIEVASDYDIEPDLIRSIIYHESKYDPKAKNGSCLGLMQVSTKWHKDRAERLGVTDFYDPKGNILLGVDYLSELIEQHGDVSLALMCYNMSHKKAKQLYSRGQVSSYAKNVLKRQNEILEGVLP